MVVCIVWPFRPSKASKKRCRACEECGACPARRQATVKMRTTGMAHSSSTHTHTHTFSLSLSLSPLACRWCWREQVSQWSACAGCAAALQCGTVLARKPCAPPGADVLVLLMLADVPTGLRRCHRCCWQEHLPLRAFAADSHGGCDTAGAGADDRGGCCCCCCCCCCCLAGGVQKAGGWQRQMQPQQLCAHPRETRCGETNLETAL